VKLTPQFGKPETYIGPGGYFASGDDIVITTLLGSCISVALYDARRRIGGLNHFMLPSQRESGPSGFPESSKYGVNAMELLINELMRLGADRKALRAKVFGGSTAINLTRKAVYDIPKMNVEFAFSFLSTERIPVDSYSVGGSFPRRIVFFPRDAKILMKYSSLSVSALEKREERYFHALLEETKNSGKPVIF
jgi:chemotaxis protein CheD